MTYIDLNEELNSMDAHAIAWQLEHELRRASWRNWRRQPRLNVAAVAAFVEDLAEAVNGLTHEELHTLLHGADEVHDLDAYQAAHLRLYGREDPYVEMEWSGVWMGD